MKRVFLIKLIILFSIFSCLWIPVISASPGPVPKEEQIIYPARSNVKPKIDGILDDETWQNPPLKKDFKTYYPTYSEILPYKTLVWITYDNENLYFAFMCYDPEPQKIKATITKRDNIQLINDDWVGISLDALGTKQTAYGFFVNPYGIQGDNLRSSVNGEDPSPDFIWEDAAKVTDQGYQVEICIPLRSISFKSGKEVKMEMLFWRKISRLGIYGSWPEVKPGQGVFNTHAPFIYKDFKNPLKLELLPSVIYGNNRERTNPQEWGVRDRFTDIGIGLKYGITSSITTDITINPDFSQVESDAFQVEVNRRYPLFFKEKRHFFMEGANILDFFTITNGYFPKALHTRRIVDPLWGAKLTGTLRKTAFCILTAGDEWPGQVWEAENNPNEGKKAFFGIARGKYGLGKDNYIGLLYSGREFAGEYNRVVGADIGYRLSKRQKINSSFLYSISGDGNSNKDKNNVTNSSDFNLLYSYITKSLVVNAAFEHIGRDFRMDSAYLMRTGIDDGWGAITYNLYPDSKKIPWLKRISPGILFQYLHDLNTNKDDFSLKLSLNFNFIKLGYFGINYFAMKENWQYETFDLNQFKISGGILLTRWIEIRGALTYGEKIYYEAQPSYKGKGYDGEFLMSLQPNKNLNQNFIFSHSDLSRGGEKIYDVNILYSRTTYQFNKYLFLRGIVQYNSYRKRILTDFLASFILIPGTVLHVGYGGLYESRKWQDNNWLYRQGDLLNIKRSLFLKVSYLWRF